MRTQRIELQQEWVNEVGLEETCSRGQRPEVRGQNQRSEVSASAWRRPAPYVAHNFITVNSIAFYSHGLCIGKHT